jgi:hypothetical protein
VTADGSAFSAVFCRQSGRLGSSATATQTIFSIKRACDTSSTLCTSPTFAKRVMGQFYPTVCTSVSELRPVGREAPFPYIAIAEATADPFPLL